MIKGRAQGQKKKKKAKKENPQTINSMRIETDIMGKGNQGNFYKGAYIEIDISLDDISILALYSVYYNGYGDFIWTKVM